MPALQAFRTWTNECLKHQDVHEGGTLSAIILDKPQTQMTSPFSRLPFQQGPVISVPLSILITEYGCSLCGVSQLA